jgi:hypothetical protein
MRVLICLLCLAVISFAQPYEPTFLYDEIGEIGQGIGNGFMAPLGDQDHDGYSDILYTVNDVENGETQWTNYLRIVYGADSPPYRTLDFAHTLTDTTQGAQHWTQWTHHSCADYNGDGEIDIMVELYPNAGGFVSGQMYLYLGGPVLFDTLWDWRSDGFEGLTSYGSIGDYDADGSADYIRANYDSTVNFYSGGWPNMQSSPTWTLGVATYPVPMRLGSGDINGDGWGDFTFQEITTYYWGDTLVQDSAYTYFWLGGPGADSIPDITLGIDIPYASHSPQWVGYWRIIGDVNGDGYDDLITWSQRNQDLSRQYIYAGGNPPNFETPIGYFDPPAAIAEIFGLLEFENLGDINGDGYEDTGFYDLEPPLGGGYLYVYLGGNPPETQPAYGVVPDIDGFVVGREMQPAGDFNNDGIDDWMFAGLDSGERRGRVLVVAGDERFGQTVPPGSLTVAEDFKLGAPYPNPFNSEVTIELEVPVGTGSVDLAIFNTLGQVVHQQKLSAWGEKIKYRWDGKDISSGIYFVTAAVGETRKVVKVAAVR